MCVDGNLCFSPLAVRREQHKRWLSHTELPPPQHCEPDGECRSEEGQPRDDDGQRIEHPSILAVRSEHAPLERNLIPVAGTLRGMSRSRGGSNPLSARSKPCSRGANLFSRGSNEFHIERKGSQYVAKRDRHTAQRGQYAANRDRSRAQGASMMQNGTNMRRSGAEMPRNGTDLRRGEPDIRRGGAV